MNNKTHNKTKEKSNTVIPGCDGLKIIMICDGCDGFFSTLIYIFFFNMKKINK